MANLPLIEASEDCCQSILEAPIGEREADQIAKGFAALADPTRLRLFSMIASRPEGEVCACALVGPMGKSQPTVSHHLRILHEAGLVDRERRGTWVWYWVVPARLETLRAALAPEAVSLNASSVG
ncbi:MAG: metalloregulator ArsR/SmtB family transcription factor [Actinomycetota bacterium]